MKRSGPLRPRSPKARAYADELESMRPLVYERSGGRCEARVKYVCLALGSHVHHLQTRARGGGNDLENLLMVCQPCHAWIHEHPVAAIVLDLLRPAGVRVPIQTEAEERAERFESEREEERDRNVFRGQQVAAGAERQRQWRRSQEGSRDAF